MRARVALLTVLVALSTLVPAALAAEPPAQGRKVEVVFVLDTTGSMGGLIAAAKQKIWAIANTLASAEPAPQIKLGLVGYRDRTDKYITKVTDLTGDLDAVYGQLMGFQAQGGGDGPESVNQALHEAVTKISWSTDDKTYRVLFLVGDAPPHMDYKDDVKYPETCKLAAKAAITINTIQCGGVGATTPIWQDIADRAEGQYFRVEQAGGAVVAATPFDKELAGLSRELEATRLYYGTREEKESFRRKADRSRAVADAAPEAAAASRAVFLSKKAGAETLAGGKDLVLDAVDGDVALERLGEEALPDVMKDMTPEQRKAYLAEQAAKRAKVQEKIRGLSAQRQAYIREQVEKANKAAGKQSLDAAIYDCIRKQAAEVGIEYKEGPVY